VPGGLDGSSLKLVAKLRINIDAAQWCHRTVLDEIQRKASQALSEVDSTWMTRYVPFLSSKKKKLKLRITELIEQLDLLEHFSRINSQGFTKICRKIDEKISTNLSELLQKKYVHDMGYHKDCSEDGNGMSMAVRDELNRILGMIGAQHESVGCASFLARSKPQGNTLTTLEGVAESA